MNDQESQSRMPDRITLAIRNAAVNFVRTYHRLKIHIAAPLPDTPSLIVSNHGFGGALDLNVLALLAALDDINERPVTFLTHQMAWTFQIGPLLETVGAQPANESSALSAFDAGHHVVVFPGGDIEAAKPFSQRNEVIFGGRTGFAQLALNADVPVVPIVTAGAGESLFVLNDGQRLARIFQADKILRCKALPVSISIPWLLNIGTVGLVPYVPLPTRLETSVLTSVRPFDGEDARAFAERIRQLMQATLDELTLDRPLLGWRG